MEKKNLNPKSHKLPRRDSSNYWLELPVDILNSVLERLGFADFRRAVSVCSSWYSASKRFGTKHQQIPWLILFSNDNDYSCSLFNPEEKGGKLYKIRVAEFTKASVCLATCGSWLFMLQEDDWCYDLYIVNLFTNEKINLPSVESQLGATKVERTLDGWFRISNDQDQRETKRIDMHSPVVWIDDKTKDYIVLWGFCRCCVVYSKKGDKFWNQIPLPSSPTRSHMVYLDHKLYFINLDNYGKSFIKIFDISREIPQETFHCDGAIASVLGVHAQSDSWKITVIKLVVTVTGELLKVEKMVRRKGKSETWSFRVYKVFNKFEQVESLANEAMLFDLGITVLANGVEGFKRNSIYSNTIFHDKKTTQICLFDLETQKMEALHKFDCSSAQQLARSRWFLPSFTHT